VCTRAGCAESVYKPPHENQFSQPTSIISLSADISNPKLACCTFEGFGEEGKSILCAKALPALAMVLESALRADANESTNTSDLPPQSRVIDLIQVAGQHILKKMWPRFLKQFKISASSAEGAYCVLLVVLLRRMAGASVVAVADSTSPHSLSLGCDGRQGLPRLSLVAR
jgi:hypothetical protein